MPRTRPPLTRDEILQTALSIVDEQGLDGLSMRKLAAALKVEAMSLYNHVQDKQDLTHRLLLLVLSDIPFPSEPLSWQNTLRHYAQGLYDTFTRHPALVPLLETMDTFAPQVLQGMELVLAALDESGLSPRQQVTAFRGLNALTMGFVMGHTQGLSLSRAQAEAHWQGWSGTQMRDSGLPHLMRLAPHFGDIHPDEDFRFVLDMFIAALEGGQPERKPGR